VKAACVISGRNRNDKPKGSDNLVVECYNGGLRVSLTIEKRRSVVASNAKSEALLPFLGADPADPEPNAASSLSLSLPGSLQNPQLHRCKISAPVFWGQL
jgi:hypothetical protein